MRPVSCLLLGVSDEGWSQKRRWPLLLPTVTDGNWGLAVALAFDGATPILHHHRQMLGPAAPAAWARRHDVLQKGP